LHVLKSYLSANMAPDKRTQELLKLAR
jgi:hypothetical protein